MRVPDWLLRRVRRIRVPAVLKRPFLIAAAFAAVALVTLGGLPVLRVLYAARWVAAEHYHVVFASLCIVPAAAVHAAATFAGLRGTAWWTVWLPGVAVYAAFPWQEDGAWRPLWIFGHAWDWGRTIFLHWDAAGPFVFNSFGSFIAMLMVAMVACGRLWTGSAKAIGRAGADALAPDAAEDALPSAAWASSSEIVKRFSDPGGIVLGELTDPTRDSPNFAPDRPGTWGGQGGGHLITMSPEKGNGHVLVTSQASGFKSTGLVIPNILTYDGPIVVFDPKCELYARTRKAREDMEFEPVVIDERNGFDPARLIAALAEDHPSAYLRMAKMVIPKGHGGIENSQYFKDAATNLFCALLAHYGGTGSMSILQDIARILAGSANDAHSTLKDELPESPATFVENEINALKGMDPKFWASIKTEITNQLLFCTLPDVERFITMKPGSKLPSQIVDPRCDIYINVPQDVAEDFAPMLRLMLGSMLTAAQLMEINEKPRARRLFLIDEAAKLGAMDILANIRDRGRSLGLHLMMFYQTPGELERIWGRAGMTSWRDGCSATIMGPVSSRTSAQDLSAMMGTRMLRLKTESTSTSNPVMSPMSGSVSMSEQEQLRDVALISPMEISQLPPHASIITATGKKPMLASKAIWFTRQDMKEKVRGTDEIEGELPVAEAQKKLTRRLDDLTQVDEETARWASLSREDLVAMQRRNMDDDSEPVILGMRARPDAEGPSLSERARARAPRYEPEEKRDPRSVNVGGRGLYNPQGGNGTMPHPKRASEGTAADVRTETADQDPCAIPVEDDLEPPCGLDGPGQGQHDAGKPGNALLPPGTTGEASPQDAGAGPEAAPIHGSGGAESASADEEEDKPPKVVGVAPVKSEEPAEAGPEGRSGETAAAESGDLPPGAARGMTAHAHEATAATSGGSDRPRPVMAVQPGTVVPDAIEIEHDIEPHQAPASPDPAPAPPRSGERMESVSGAVSAGERLAAAGGSEGAAPRVAAGVRENGGVALAGPEDASEAKPADEGHGHEGPEPAAGIRGPMESGDVGPDALEIEEDFEPPWPTMHPVPSPASSPEPDERTEDVPGDGAGAETWTSKDRVEFMSLSATGMSLEGIAEELGKSLASVQAWLKSQDAHGLMPGGVGDVDGGPGDLGDHGPEGPA